MTYFASSVPGLMIFVHLATWRTTKGSHNGTWAMQLLSMQAVSRETEFAMNRLSGRTDSYVTGYSLLHNKLKAYTFWVQA